VPDPPAPVASGAWVMVTIWPMAFVVVRVTAAPYPPLCCANPGAGHVSGVGQLVTVCVVKIVVVPIDFRAVQVP